MSDFFKENPRILVGMILGALFALIYQLDTNNWGFYVPQVMGGAMWGGIVAAKSENDEQAIHRMTSGTFIGAVIGSFVLLLIAAPINKLVGFLFAGALIGLGYRWAFKGALIGIIFGVFVGIIILLLDETMGSKGVLAEAIEGLIGGNLGELIGWLVGWLITGTHLGAIGGAMLWVLGGETPSSSRRRRGGLHHKEANLPNFASPFSPSQWVRIVWSVWINQLWYWQNVRPLLSKKKRNWSILAQACLGATFVGISLSIIIGSILDFTSLTPNWLNLMQGASAGALIPLLWVVLPIKDGDVDRVPWIICCSVSGSITGSLAFAYSENSWIIYQIGIACLFLLGGAFGIYNGVLNSLPSCGCDYIMMIFMVSLPMIIMNINRELNQLFFQIMMVIIFYLSVKIGNRWAIRQVPNEETRKGLVNPNGRMSK